MRFTAVCIIRSSKSGASKDVHSHAPNWSRISIDGSMSKGSRIPASCVLNISSSKTLPPRREARKLLLAASLLLFGCGILLFILFALAHFTCKKWRSACANSRAENAVLYRNRSGPYALQMSHFATLSGLPPEDDEPPSYESCVKKPPAYP